MNFKMSPKAEMIPKMDLQVSPKEKIEPRTG